MSERRALLICGLIRDHQRFGDYLDGLLRLRRGDLRVILSTWTGELARYPGIARRLAELGADIAEQTQPDLKLPGHILHQAMTLDLGLSLLDDDVFVLKVRPDISSLGDVQEFLALAPEPAEPGRLAAPFGHRVHVVGMFGAHPLYINDIIFAGMARDLRRLCPLPFGFGLKYPRLAPEQWLWATALVADNPVLDAYLGVNPGLIFGEDAGNAGLRHVLAGAPLFARALAVTAIVVRDSLAYFHPDTRRAEIAEACAEYTLDALLWDAVEIPGLDHHPTARTNTFLSAGLLDAVHDGRYRPSPLGERVWAAMARYGGMGGMASLQRDRGALAADAAELAEGLRRIGIGGSQNPVDGAHLRHVERGRGPWSLAETGSGYAAALEAEVNQLRRTVDQLQARLASK